MTKQTRENIEALSLLGVIWTMGVAIGIASTLYLKDYDDPPSSLPIRYETLVAKYETLSEMTPEEQEIQVARWLSFEDPPWKADMVVQTTEAVTEGPYRHDSLGTMRVLIPVTVQSTHEYGNTWRGYTTILRCENGACLKADGYWGPAGQKFKIHPDDIDGNEYSP